MSEPTFIATIEKSTREDVRVALDHFHGHDLIDLRIWSDFTAGPATVRGPTKKGVALNVAKLPELIASLQKAQAEAERRGLL